MNDKVAEKVCEIYNTECRGGIDKHHIKSRGAGGSNEPDNLINLCRFHHTEVHGIGRWTFAKKYNLVDRFINATGSERGFTK